MKLKKILAACAAGGILFTGGNALVNASSDDLIAFKEAYLSAPVDNRMFNENIDFFGPTFHGEVISDGFIFRDASMRMSGRINWEYTNPNTNQTADEIIPFYIEQTNDEMTMYVQRNNRWYKFMLPSVPVGLANAIKSTDINILTQNMNAVKDVEILRDNDEERVMNITLDGKKLAELMHQYNDNKISNMNSYEMNAQKGFMDHLTDALATTDLKCAWTVDKQTWQSKSATVDFTNVMRAYAKDVLNDAAKGEITLNSDDRKFYESLGYFAELHTKATYYKANEDAKPTMPSNAANALTNENIFNDLVKEVATSTKK